MQFLLSWMALRKKEKCSVIQTELPGQIMTFSFRFLLALLVDDLSWLFDLELCNVLIYPLVHSVTVAFGLTFPWKKHILVV